MKHLVCFSAGLESTTIFLELYNKFDKEDIIIFHLSYGFKWEEAERYYIQKIAKIFNIKTVLLM